MSHPDPEPGEGGGQISQRLLQQDEFAAALTAEGHTDVLIVGRENGRDVLTDSRRELIDYLDQHGEEIESVSDLARSTVIKARSARISTVLPSSTLSRTRGRVTGRRNARF